MGGRADLVMVNSGWTKSHIDSIWKQPHQTSIVYPPCDTSAFDAIPLDWASRSKERYVVSVGQFREEKKHQLQLEAFALLFHDNKYQDSGFEDIKLVLIGSCRETEGDWHRLEMLKKLAKELKIEVCYNMQYFINYLQFTRHFKIAPS